MKHFWIILMASWFGVIDAKPIGHVVPQHSALQLKTDNNNVEVYRDNGDGNSWLQMVLVFTRDTGNNQSTALIEKESCTESEKTTTCQHGLIQLETKKCYYFSIQKQSFYNAMKVCETMEATLAHPLNGIENDAIVKHLKTNFPGTQGWWLGGSDEAKEGEWVWTHNKALIIYTDWLPGQPTNTNKNEHCLQYWKPDLPSEWQWNDRICTEAHQFICQQ